MVRFTSLIVTVMLAMVIGLSVTVVPVAQGFDRDWTADSVDTARSAQQRKSPIGQPGYGRDRVADSVDTARSAQQRKSPIGQPGYGRDRVADSVDTAIEITQTPAVPGDGFDWADAGIGAAAALALALLGTAAHLLRRYRVAALQ